MEAEASDLGAVSAMTAAGQHIISDIIIMEFRR
jgi:hypothetical protein